jgi:CheY-like chemotaxis protein
VESTSEIDYVGHTQHSHEKRRSGVDERPSQVGQFAYQQSDFQMSTNLTRPAILKVLHLRQTVLATSTVLRAPHYIRRNRGDGIAAMQIKYELERSKRPMTRRVRVLIADDRPRSREGLRALLATSPNIEVIGEANNGQEAVRLVDERCPDVVLMDVRMPVMDGLNATRCITSRWPDVKVIVLTLYGAYRANAFKAGAFRFLIKGCPAEELLDAIGLAETENSGYLNACRYTGA